jgi:hypothetical protein
MTLILQSPLEAHLQKIKTIYRSMDRAYRDCAAYYDFDCQGCEDNCCTTYFFHYTFAESLYLLEGLRTLEEGMKEEILERATNMGNPSSRDHYLCPLNFGGRCLLYPYRTMICRLHGLPFEVKRPNGPKEEGPGCPQLEKERALKGLHCRRIDRTPFYADLAKLEGKIRAEISPSRKFKKTIAEMIRDGGREGGLRKILPSLMK